LDEQIVWIGLSPDNHSAALLFSRSTGAAMAGAQISSTNHRILLRPASTPIHYTPAIQFFATRHRCGAEELPTEFRERGSGREAGYRALPPLLS
jgi:hypothetical protein